MKYIVANWKSNLTIVEAGEWMEKFLGAYKPREDVKIMVAPGFPFLFELKKMVDEKKPAHLDLGVQNLSPFPFGAYTGEVAAAMVKGVVDFAILGHSERRKYFGETNQKVANKVSEAVKNGIKPIVCVDEPYAKAQVAAIDDGYLKEVIIAYEPIEAIGTGTPEDPSETKRVVGEIHKILPEAVVIYGGSVNEENVGDYLKIEGVSGLLVGGASLKPEKFAEICAG